MGEPIPDAFSGRSLVPLLQSGKAAEDHVYIEWNHAPRKSNKKEKINLEDVDNIPVDVSDDFVRTVIASDGWKLCLSDKDKCQLFNLSKDPGETTNLFYKSERRDVIKNLTRKIHQWQKKVGDTVSI
jgi:hypothetical protein